MKLLPPYAPKNHLSGTNHRIEITRKVNIPSFDHWLPEMPPIMRDTDNEDGLAMLCNGLGGSEHRRLPIGGPCCNSRELNAQEVSDVAGWGRCIGQSLLAAVYELQLRQKRGLLTSQILSLQATLWLLGLAVLRTLRVRAAYQYRITNLHPEVQKTAADIKSTYLV